MSNIDKSFSKKDLIDLINNLYLKIVFSFADSKSTLQMLDNYSYIFLKKIQKKYYR